MFYNIAFFLFKKTKDEKQHHLIIGSTFEKMISFYEGLRACLSVHQVPGAYEDEKRASDPMEIEL